MNSLRKALDLNRGNETDGEIAHLCYSTKAQASTLQVQTSKVTRWVLPWMHFVYGQLHTNESSERLVLIFLRHELDLRGRNLGQLAEAAADLTLVKINVLPVEFREAFAEQPFIEEIEVVLVPSYGPEREIIK